MSLKREPVRCISCKQIPDLADLVPRGSENALLCASCKEKGYTTMVSGGQVIAVPPKNLTKENP